MSFEREFDVVEFDNLIAKEKDKKVLEKLLLFEIEK